MDKPTYREYKNYLEEYGGLPCVLSSYIETKPYRFKYVQIVIFVLITAVALLVSYIVTGMENKTSFDIFEYNLVTKIIIWPTLVYYCLTLFLLMNDNPLRYLFSGIKRVSKDYVQVGRDAFAKGIQPSYLDILIDPGLQNKELKRQKRFLYCPNGRVFEEKRFKVFNALCSIMRTLVCMSLLIVNLYISLHLAFADSSAYDIYMNFYALIILAVIYTFVFFGFPAIRWRFGRFEEADINMLIAEKEEEKYLYDKKNT